MRKRLLAIAMLILPVAAMAQAPAAGADAPLAQEASEPVKFLRFVEDEISGAARLEAAEVTYVNADGVTLRLVSAVHIAEQAYYDALQANFANDDAVLYEMVKPRGQRPPARGANNDHSVAQLQQFLRDKLDLAYQLDAIDYRAKNFVHADLDLETFQRLQNERGESMATILMRSITQTMARGDSAAGGDSASQLLFMLAAPDPDRQVKLQLARQMEDVELLAAQIDGPNGSVILSERNKAAIAALQRELSRGKKRLSIFYGAAHMPDMARRVEALGFAPRETRWHQAWDVTIRKDKPSMLQKWFGAAPATRPADSR